MAVHKQHNISVDDFLVFKALNSLDGRFDTTLAVLHHHAAEQKNPPSLDDVFKILKDAEYRFFLLSADLLKTVKIKAGLITCRRKEREKEHSNRPSRWVGNLIFTME